MAQRGIGFMLPNNTEDPIHLAQVPPIVNALPLYAHATSSSPIQSRNSRRSQEDMASKSSTGYCTDSDPPPQVVRGKFKKKRAKPRKRGEIEDKLMLASESDIVRCNEAFWRTYDCGEGKRKGEEVARRVASMAKDIGVIGGGGDEALVRTIQQLEDREVDARAQRGQHNRYP